VRVIQSAKQSFLDVRGIRIIIPGSDGSMIS
jgi:hypothetical protein